MEGITLYFTPEYRVRYRYSGRLNFVYQYTKTLDNSGKSAYIENKTYNFQWAHNVDSKAHPGQNFSANVNLMSAKFNNYILTNPTAVYNNSINSSIAYSKTFGDGKYNLTINANHNQNNLTGLVNINAPSIGFTAITIYPFAPKDLVGTPKWYQKLGIGLNSNITGFTSFYDSMFSFKHLLDTFKYGAQNNIPITLALPQLGFLQISPGVSYQNRVFNTKYDYNWDDYHNKVDTILPERDLSRQFRSIFSGFEYSDLRNLPAFRKKQPDPRHSAYGAADHQFFLFSRPVNQLL